MALNRREFLAGFFGALVAAQVVSLPGPAPTSGKLSDREKGRLIAEAMKTPEGRVKLAQSMMQPLRRNLDYQAIGRKVFPVQELPQRALHIYDRNPDTVAYVVGDEGETRDLVNMSDAEFNEELRQIYGKIGHRLAEDSDAVDRIVENLPRDERIARDERFYREFRERLHRRQQRRLDYMSTWNFVKRAVSRLLA